MSARLLTLILTALIAQACASATCEENGTCDPEDTTADTSADATADADTSTDTSTDATADTSTDATSNTDATADADAADTTPTTCVPNDDGVISRAEVPLRVGLFATFRVATDVSFDTTGQPQDDGTYTWNLADAFPGDHNVILELQDPTGAWYAEDFPDATYVSRLSDTNTLLGVFQITPDALLLLGVVSPDDSFDRTLLTYDPAVTVLAFPFQLGDSWSTSTSVSGTASGVIAFYSEDYTYTVDKAGTLQTPFATFPALRVHSELTRTVNFIPTSTQTHLFASECFGTVASITSDAGESDTEFTNAAELRRLSP